MLTKRKSSTGLSTSTSTSSASSSKLSAFRHSFSKLWPRRKVKDDVNKDKAVDEVSKGKGKNAIERSDSAERRRLEAAEEAFLNPNDEEGYYDDELLMRRRTRSRGRSRSKSRGRLHTRKAGRKSRTLAEEARKPRWRRPAPTPAPSPPRRPVTDHALSTSGLGVYRSYSHLPISPTPSVPGRGDSIPRDTSPAPDSPRFVPISKPRPQLVLDALQATASISDGDGGMGSALSIVQRLDVEALLLAHELDLRVEASRNRVRAGLPYDSGKQTQRAVFGVPLSQSSIYGSSPVVLGGYQLELPLVVVVCVEELFHDGITSPDLFKSLPNPGRLRELVAKFNGLHLREDPLQDPPSLTREGRADVCALLSTYMMALPKPVVQDTIRDALYEICFGGGETESWASSSHASITESTTSSSWSASTASSSASASQDRQRIKLAQLTLHLLPTPNFGLFVYLLAFLAQIIVAHRRRSRRGKKSKAKSRKGDEQGGLTIAAVGEMFGGWVFGSEEEEDGKHGGADLLIWFLVRWDRISDGLLDVGSALSSAIDDTDAASSMSASSLASSQHPQTSSLTSTRDDRTEAWALQERASEDSDRNDGRRDVRARMQGLGLADLPDVFDHEDDDPGRTPTLASSSSSSRHTSKSSDLARSETSSNPQRRWRHSFAPSSVYSRLSGNSSVDTTTTATDDEDKRISHYDTVERGTPLGRAASVERRDRPFDAVERHLRHPRGVLGEDTTTTPRMAPRPLSASTYGSPVLTSADVTPTLPKPGRMATTTRRNVNASRRGASTESRRPTGHGGAGEETRKRMSLSTHASAVVSIMRNLVDGVKDLQVEIQKAEKEVVDTEYGTSSGGDTGLARGTRRADAIDSRMGRPNIGERVERVVGKESAEQEALRLGLNQLGWTLEALVDRPRVGLSTSAEAVSEDEGMPALHTLESSTTLSVPDVTHPSSLSGSSDSSTPFEYVDQQQPSTHVSSPTKRQVSRPLPIPPVAERSSNNSATSTVASSVDLRNRLFEDDSVGTSVTSFWGGSSSASLKPAQPQAQLGRVGGHTNSTARSRSSSAALRSPSSFPSELRDSNTTGATRRDEDNRSTVTSLVEELYNAMALPSSSSSSPTESATATSMSMGYREPAAAAEASVRPPAATVSESPGLGLSLPPYLGTALGGTSATSSMVPVPPLEVRTGPSRVLHRWQGSELVAVPEEGSVEYEREREQGGYGSEEKDSALRAKPAQAGSTPTTTTTTKKDVKLKPLILASSAPPQHSREAVVSTKGTNSSQTSPNGLAIAAAHQLQGDESDIENSGAALAQDALVRELARLKVHNAEAFGKLEETERKIAWLESRLKVTSTPRRNSTGVPSSSVVVPDIVVTGASVIRGAAGATAGGAGAGVEGMPVGADLDLV